MKTYKRVLTIAGSDSSGGAGIQADLKTFSALECYGMSVITALTAQNTIGVQDIFPVSPLFISTQLDSVLSDIGADAVKTGMLFSPEIIRIVADKLKEYNITNIVVDPVIVAKSGDKLLQDEAVDAMIKELFPIATVITPNLYESEVILEEKITTPDEFLKAGELLLDKSKSVYLKNSGNSIKLKGEYFFFRKNDLPVYELFEFDKIDTSNLHGTGCSLSSAIAAGLAKGNNLYEAVKLAKNYIHNAISAGSEYKTGKGKGPVHHFFDYWI